MHVLKTSAVFPNPLGGVLTSPVVNLTALIALAAIPSYVPPVLNAILIPSHALQLLVMLTTRALRQKHAYRRLGIVQRISHVLNLIALTDGALIALHPVRVELLLSVVISLMRRIAKEMKDVLW